MFSEFYFYFEIPYRDRFNDGEFRKRVQFMYSGELKTVRFKYSGVLEAILDKLPTAKILSEDKGTYVISAETYGDGIYMWLRSQGDKAEISIKPTTVKYLLSIYRLTIYNKGNKDEDYNNTV